MTTITGTAYDVSGAPLAERAVSARLVAATTALGGSGGQVITSAQTTTDETGAWSLTLTPASALLEPEGAYYVVTVGTERYTITVPDDGTHELGAVLVVPGPLPSLAATTAALAVLAADLAAHVGDETDVHGITDTSALVTGDDSRLSDARTPTAHAASHAAGGADAVSPASIGALAAYGRLILSPEPGTRWSLGASVPTDGVGVGDRFTYISGEQAGETYRWDGDSWEIEGILSAPEAQIAAAVEASPLTTSQVITGALTVSNPGARAYRFRQGADGGTALDLEGAGSALVVSMWTNPDFTGSQHTYLWLESAFPLAFAVGRWIFVDGPYGSKVLDVQPGTGLGFFGADASGKPTVSGSLGGDLAGVVASLVTALAGLGLITDDTEE